MTIALFSDIHANLPAFEAMLQDMDKRNPDAIYCLGDLVGYHIWPNEIIAEIRDRKIATLKGNHDEKVEHILTTEESLSVSGNEYAYHIIGKDERKYLFDLPSYITVDYKIDHGNLRIAMAHGSTRKINEYILEDTDADYVINMMDESNADILVVGHSHIPYHRVLKDSNGKYKHVINTGSVGKPKDFDNRGGYVILTIHDYSTLEIEDSINVKFIRFEYDIEKSVKAIKNSPLPNELAERLIIGK
ncbi:metallophosphoesterase family protein [Flavobacterium lindanitolerans]|uniref:metallophosphoesterase family protein n=1 Tax=Bacteroidota TaxID=976 RepID=UPI0027B91A06|nr:metallophosphoesterase family protein [Flavobacterium lindanitolerans]